MDNNYQNMLSVSQREFQIKFYSFSKGVEAVEIIGRGGVVVGYFHPPGVMCPERISEDGEIMVEEVKSPTKVVGSFVQNAAAKKFENILGEEEQVKPETTRVKCKKCGGVGAGTHVYWDELELESVEGVFCLRCAKLSRINLKPLE
jgi:hypothetical protein